MSQSVSFTASPSPTEAWAPVKGELIAATNSEPLELFLIDTRGLAVVRRLVRSESSGFVVAWSPSGNNLAFTTFTEGIGTRHQVLEVDTGEITEIVTPPESHSFVWLDDAQALVASGPDLFSVKLGSPPTRYGGPSDWGICEAGKCPLITGLALGTSGRLAVTHDSGHAVVIGIDGKVVRSRSPDKDHCHRPNFHPIADKVGVNCTRPPDNYDPMSSDPSKLYANNGWILDIQTLRWEKADFSAECHECSSDYFPWTKDGSQYLAASRSESPCSGSFEFRPAGNFPSKTFNGHFGNFSPDGTRFVYQTYPTGGSSECDGKLVVVEPDGRESEVSPVDSGYPPLWSPTRG